MRGSELCAATTRSVRSAGSSIDPCYVFHVANAYDAADGNSIVLQAVRYPELWRNNGGFDADGALWSWTINLADGTVTERQLDDRAVEFPRIDDRLAGLPARYTVSVAGDRLVRYDLTDGMPPSTTSVAEPGARRGGVRAVGIRGRRTRATAGT